MLKGLDPLLTGECLLHLDRLGHSDTVVITDAHFPAHRIGGDAPVLDIPTTTPHMAAAVHSVIALDDVHAVTLMDSGAARNEAQLAIIKALGVHDDVVRALDRYTFYELAGEASLIIRTAETRIYANVILSKGVTPTPASSA